MMATAPGASVALTDTQRVFPASHAEEEDDHTSREVLYGYADLMIVGCRYYRGVAHLGEFVDLVREPNNSYDRNAIRVDNLARQQVGHIKATQACILASLLDDRTPGAPRVEASVSVGGTRVYNLPIRANVFGPPERAPATISALTRLFLRGGLTGRPGASSGPSRPYEGHAVAVQKAVSTPVKTQRELDEMFDKLDASSPQLPTPQTSANTDPVLETALMEHQKQGLAWMVQRENNPDTNGLPPFWEQRVEEGKLVFYNTITCSSQPRSPAPVHGGILSDDMGLGKTLQLVALILAQPPAGTGYIAKVRAVEANKRLKEQLDRGEVTAPTEEREPTPQEKQEHAAKEYKKLKKADLAKELASKGLDTKGNKSELVDRLSGHEAGLTPVNVVDARLGTLVVCPMSVLSNWETQLAEHVKEGALDVYPYHGGSRNHDATFLAKKDVVITTYDTLASDFAATGGEKAFREDEAAAAGGKRKRRHGVMALGWNRIVLDEAHTIRNNKTTKHKACLALSSRYRWCMTGTPMVNKPEDIGALFSFLRLTPASNPRVFTQAIGRPIRSGSEAGLARLRVLVKSVCLRRTKSILGDKVPPKVVEIHRVEMDDEHREAYNTLFNSARAAFKAALAEGESEVMSMYSSVLECLLRLRQVCCADSLVPAGRLEQARKVLHQLAKDGPKLGKEEAVKLFAKLKGLLEQDEGAECAVCLELVEPADARVLRGCGHGFCSKCLGAMVKAGPPVQGGGGNSGCKNKCPLCRIEFSEADVVGGAELEKAGGNAKQLEQERGGEGGAAGGLASAAVSAAAAGAAGVEEEGGKGVKVPPPKVAALLQSLHELRRSGNGDKAVVFSQFTGFLDVIQPFLLADGFRLCRLDGTMTNKRRRAELKRFSGKGHKAGEGAEVMLASLMAAGTGVNLTSANHCFICDPWWNASVESQAMDRVHRIGQTKPVRVVRMVSADSIEDRILEMQEAKEALGKGALRKLKPEEARKARMTDLRTIFECKHEEGIVVA